MRAAVLVEQHAPLVIAEVEIPPLAVGQVLVRVAYSGICGTQLNEIRGTRGGDRFLPHLLGHEGSGAVVEVGPGVRKVKPGEPVVLHWMKGSGIDAVAPTFRRNGATVSAGCITTLGEYAVVSENRLTPIPADVKPDAACLLGCAVTTGLGIVLREAAVRPGQSIVVFGVGGVGLNVIQGAALVSAYPIIAVDLREDKLRRAVAFGATHTVDAAQADVPEALRALTHGEGFDVAVDTTGNSTVLQTAYDLTGRAGTTVMAGVIHHLQPITIDPYPLHFGRRLIGSHGGSTQPDVDIRRYLQLYRLGRLKLEEQITHRYVLDEINEAIAVAQRGVALRCVIEMPTTGGTTHR